MAKMKDNLMVKIPVEWLLTLAVHGNMGDGEIPDIMQRWAKNKLIEAGYQKEYSDRQREKIKEATQKIKNIIGDDKTSKVLMGIVKGMAVIDAGIEALGNEQQ